MDKQKRIVISNHKGGVGKTTCTINIGAGLARLGYKVLMIDADPQANLTQSLGVPTMQHLYGAMRGQYELPVERMQDNLFVCPSTLDLTAVEAELLAEIGREFVLHSLLEPLKRRFDYILIDCPPSLGLLTINAMCAAHAIIIPVQAEYLAVQGLVKLTDVITKIRQHLNKSLEIGGIIITRYDQRKNLNRISADTVQNFFLKSTVVFKTFIRENISIAEAPALQKDIFSHAPSSNGAQDFEALCVEIVQNKQLG